MIQLGPGMYQQSSGPCSECGGTGEQIDPAKRCKNCNGKKVVKEKKVLTCEVDKGAPHGEKYVFHGESDAHPDKEPGDVILMVNEQPHATFKRKGADILMEKEITLLEALSGVDFVVDFLDGSKFRVQTEPGAVVKPDSLMTIPEKGLPFHKNPYKFGNMFVLFTVKFPASLGATELAGVSEMLKGMKKKNAQMSDAAEEHKLIAYSAD